MNSKQKTAIARTLASVAAVLVIVGGVTFASLQSKDSIVHGNTISTAVANLQLSSNGTSYSNTIDGYSFANLIPGGVAVPNNGYPIYLKNSGTTGLNLALSVSHSLEAPTAVDLDKVRVILTPLEGGTPQSFTLHQLVSASDSNGIPLTVGSHMMANQVQAFSVRISMDADAVTGAAATIANIDFVFGAQAG